MGNRKLTIIAVLVGIVIAMALFFINNPEEDGQAYYEERNLVVKPEERPGKVRSLLAKNRHRTVGRKNAPQGNSSDESKKIKKELKAELLSGNDERVCNAVGKVVQLDDEDLVDLLEEVLPRIQDAGYRKDLIGNLALIPRKKSLDILYKMIRDEDKEVRLVAMDSLALSEGSLAEAVAQANDEEESKNMTPEQRKDILANATGTLEIDNMAAAFKAAMQDPDEDVRLTAVKAVTNASPELQYCLYRDAMVCEQEDVRKEAFRQVATANNKDTIVLVMGMLDDKNPELREQVRDYVKHILGKEFNSAREAGAWWQQNSSKYDYDMVEIDSGLEN